MQKLRFEPHLIPTLATIAGLALFVNLGLWQAGKAERRSAELEQFGARARLGPFAIGGQLVDPVQLQDAPATVKGVYETQFQFFVDNRQEDGQPGCARGDSLEDHRKRDPDIGQPWLDRMGAKPGCVTQDQYA
jgi:cytochrome oxidase assembly protein ShyY1